MTTDTDSIDGDIRESEVMQAIGVLLHLLNEERDHPESMASGHGHALKVGIAVMEDWVERSRRLSGVKGGLPVDNMGGVD